MMRIVYGFLLSLLIMTVISCVKDSEIDLPEVEDVMTLNLILSPDKRPVAILTNSVDLSSEKGIADILNADLSLYADGEFIGSFSPEEFVDSYRLLRIGYKFPLLISPKVNEYTIEIGAPGYVDIEASTKSVARSSSSEIIQMDSISIVNPDATYQDFLGHFTMGFKDDDPASNYYHLIVYQEALRMDEMTGEWTPHSPKNPVSFSRSDLNLEDEIISNDRHGYLLYRTLSGILISDELFNTEYYTIESKTLLPSGGPAGPDGLPLDHRFLVKMYAEFRSVNEDYYKYYRSITLQMENETNPFSEPVIIHSNVNGGLGAMSYYTAVTTDTVYLEY